jgi:hypothetical protein
MRSFDALVAISLLVGCLSVSSGNVTPISRQQGALRTNAPGYSYVDGTVFHHGRAILRVEQIDRGNYQTDYVVKDARGEIQAEVTFASWYQNTLICRANFEALGVHYEARIPIVPFTDLLSSYIDNGVLLDGKLDPDRLLSYAASREIELVDTAAQVRRLSMAGAQAKCRQCAEDFRRCQVDASRRRASPGGGVRVTESCESQFQGCSQGGFVIRRSEWPCGPAPH